MKGSGAVSPALQRLAQPGRARWHLPLLVLIGIIAGGAAGLNSNVRSNAFDTARIWLRVLGGAALATAALTILDFATRGLIGALRFHPETKRRYLKYDVFTSSVFLVTLLGAFGFQILPPIAVAAGVTFVVSKVVLLRFVSLRDERSRVFSSLGWLAFLFLLSGVAALIYQVVWQRALFAAFGINIESITIIVSLFMFGLGLGSLLGGFVSKRYPTRLLSLFVACELGIGLFGIASLPLIEEVSTFTLHGSLLTVSVAVFSLLCFPTILMGATLPILVTHLFRQYRNLGKSVGILYFINTLGSAVACFLASDGLFVFLGQQASVMVAAACNLTVATLVTVYARRTRATAVAQTVAEDIAQGGERV